MAITPAWVNKPRTDTSSSAVAHIESRMQNLAARQPGLPAVPTRPLEYAGWLGEVRKRYQLRQMTHSAIEHTAFLKEVNALQSEVLTLVQTRTEIGRVQAHAEVESMELEARKRQLRQDEEMAGLELEARKKKRQAEVAGYDMELQLREKRVELRMAKYEAEIERIKNPPAALPPPAPEDPVAARMAKMQALTEGKQRELTAFLESKGMRSRNELEDADQDIYDQIANHWDAKIAGLYQ